MKFTRWFYYENDDCLLRKESNNVYELKVGSTITIKTEERITKFKVYEIDKILEAKEVNEYVYLEDC